MIRVLIVHDSSILSTGLRMMLSSAIDIQVVGEANDDRVAALAAELDPHVVLVDADSCGGGGLNAVRMLLAYRPQIGIVMLGLHDDPETRAGAMRAGACSFVPKREPERMLEEIRSLGRLPC
jgi:DNA-binding NarL/FixJ family response regulator